MVRKQGKYLGFHYLIKGICVTMLNTFNSMHPPPDKHPIESDQKESLLAVQFPSDLLSSVPRE